MSNQFWAVCCFERGGPTVKHQTEHGAIQEAERLARLNPGAKFYVLQAVELRCVDAMQRIDLRDPMREIPF